jgi:hypothetical protein
MNAPSLAELQSAMMQRILGEEDSIGLDTWIAVPSGVDAVVRLDVHRDAYPARIAASIEEAYPALANIVGAGSLANLTRRFIEAGGGRESNLNLAGQTLPTFLLKDRLIEDLPFLADLAALEWAVFECFHSAIGSRFDVTSTVDFTPEEWADARVVFRPGTTVVTSTWPIRELWESRELSRSKIDVDLNNRSDRVLVYRDEYSVEVRSVDRVEALALAHLLEGKSLGHLMVELSEFDAAPGRVNTLFRSWTTIGLVSGCRPA